MDRILVDNPDTGRRKVLGYFHEGVFLRKKARPDKDIDKKHNGYLIDSYILDDLLNRGCKLIHFEVIIGKGQEKQVQIIESEFEDWLINSKNVKTDKGRQKCLPLQFWREPSESKRLDNKPQKSKKQEKLELMATINMHSPTETRFCRKCEKFTGKEPRMNCQAGRFWTGKTSPKSRRKVQVYILADAPGDREINDPEGRFLIGPSGMELGDWLDEAGIDPRGVYVDNVIRCALPYDFGDYQTAERNQMIRNCSVYLFNELSRLKPDIVIPTGRTALWALMGVSSITRWMGRHVKHKKLNAHIVPMLHPAAVLWGRIYDKPKQIEYLEYIKTLVGTKPEFKPVDDIFVTDKRAFDRCMREMTKAPEIIIDLETIGADNFAETAKIIGIALCAHESRGYFLPLWKLKQVQDEDGQTTQTWDFDNPAWSKVQMAQVNKLMSDKKKLKVFHNAGFDVNWLLHFGFKLQEPIYDTIIANSVLDDIDNGLKDLAWLYTDFGGYQEEMESVPGYKPSEMHKVDPFTLAKYAAYDGVATWRLKRAQDKQITEHPARELIPELNRLRYHLCEMELEGCRVDLKRTAELKEEYLGKMDEVEEGIRVLVKAPKLNLNSPVQLLELCYGDGGLLSEYDVKHSTDKRVFEEILRKIRRKKTPTQKNNRQKKVIEDILEYRTFKKRVSTYLNRFLNGHVDFRIHPHFTVFVVITGRTSSRDPNLQNIPRKGGIRSCFVAEKGCDLIEFDYSQLELRIAAELSQDEGMLTILNDPKGDIHSVVGQVSFKKPDGTDYPIERFKEGEPRAGAKIISFSTIYGKTPKSLAFDLDCTVEEASRVYRYLLDGFPQLKEFIISQHAYVAYHGYIETLFGRRIPVAGAQSNDQSEVEGAYRCSVNYPIQSAASDIVILALNRIKDRMKKEKWPAKMLLTVHDSILFNVERGFKKEFIKLVKQEMERPLPQVKHVKLYADYKVGKNWGDMK